MSGDEDHLSLIHNNIRSSNANLDSFLAYLETLNFIFTIIALTETWLNDKDDDLFDIAGYNHISAPRVYGKGGGVSIYLREHISYNRRNDLKYHSECFEC